MKNDSLGHRTWTMCFFLLLTTVASSAQAQEAARFEKTECAIPGLERFETPVECGILHVPEDRSNPESRRLKLSVAVIRAKGSDPAPDPVVYLAGGPGGVVLKSFGQWVDHPLRDKRDLVLMDHRGVGSSEPLCPDLLKEIMRIGSRDLSAQEDGAANVEAARRCKASLEARGVALTAYTRVDAARDLEDLRRALGYERWNLVGTSYGGMLAQTVMREAPQSVRSATLDSTAPLDADFYADIAPHFEANLERLTRKCMATAACRSATPDVGRLYREFLAELKRAPLSIPIDAPQLFPSGAFVFNAQDLALFAGQLISDPDMHPVLPAFLLAWKDGETASLGILITIFAGFKQDMGLYYALQCRDEAPWSAVRDPRAVPEFRTIAMHGAIGGVCDDWGLEPSDPKANAPVTGDIPTLILAGANDSLPETYAQRIRAKLGQSHLLVAPGGGHGVLNRACARRMLATFLDDPSQRPDDTCFTSWSDPDPVGGAVVTTGVLEWIREMENGFPWGILATLCALVLLTSAVVVWPIRALIRRWRAKTEAGEAGPRPRGKTAALLIVAAALLSWAWMAVFAGAFTEMMATYEILILLGLPASAGPLLVLSKLILLTTLAGGILGMLATKKETWSLYERIHFAIAAAGGLLLVGVLAGYDLF